MVKQTATYTHKEVQYEASHEYIHICTSNNKPLRIYRSSETNDCSYSYQCCSTEEDLYELSLITVSQDQSAVINDVSYSPAFQPPCSLSVRTWVGPANTREICNNNNNTLSQHLMWIVNTLLFYTDDLSHLFSLGKLCKEYELWRKFSL